MVSPVRPLNTSVDICILINFALISRINLLAGIKGFIFYVLDEVLQEVTIPEQRLRVDAAVRNGYLTTARIETVEELAAFVGYTTQFGKAESACLAVAVSRGWVLATDETKDRRFAREVTARGIQVINTPGIILKAIRDGLLTVDTADALKDELEKHRFRMNFKSFGERFGRGAAI